MTTRSEQIAAAGHVLAEGYHPDDDANLSALAARVNDGDGWTLVFSAPLGNTLRWEGVVFDAGELRRVVAVAAGELRRQGWSDAVLG